MSILLDAARLGLVVLATTPAPLPPPEDLEARCRREVVGLHEFLEDWSNAVLPDTDEAFARFGAVIPETFALVTPEGTVLDGVAVVEAIRGAHGRWREDRGRIEIRDFVLRHSGEGWAVVTYEEWHHRGGESRGRLSSAVFGLSQGAPEGVLWLHLHEVWLGADAARAGD